MKSLFWLAAGIAIGLVIGRKAAGTPAGRRFFSDLDTKTRDFSAAVSDGYRRREAELRQAVEGAADDIAGLSNN